MPIFASQALLREDKKILGTKYYPNKIEPLAQISKSNTPSYTNWALST